ncbi:hypothetical protein [Rhizobium chutanense]|uniref:hypothetical protein n=1 Tax=Rhizobium chutanense TaxID=2035448 RepID=UPI0018EFADDE|nr:hypothetical protein [Rhizobium chutanense]
MEEIVAFVENAFSALWRKHRQNNRRNSGLPDDQFLSPATFLYENISYRIGDIRTCFVLIAAPIGECFGEKAAYHDKSISLPPAI